MSKNNNLDLNPKRPVSIKVLGVGGGGGNAVNSMILSKELPEDLEFIIVNTDIQALDVSPAQYKIQIGKKITRGLGSGSDPDTGRRSAEEDIEAIKKSLDGSDLVFLTAGLGGGTGTGALPVITKVAKDMGILSVVVITKPFAFEGRRRAVFTKQALESLSKVADTIIVVPNQKLLEVADPKTTMMEAFQMSNNVLKQAVRGIADIIQKTGLVNVDFADVRSIIKEMGLAIMGSGCAAGADRARIAALEAINSPLLDNISVQGARGILLNITGSASMGLHEINEAAQVVYKQVSEDANIIIGSVIDEAMGDNLQVTVVATGLDSELSKHVFELNDSRPSMSFEPSRRDSSYSTQRSSTENLDRGFGKNKNQI